MPPDVKSAGGLYQKRGYMIHEFSRTELLIGEAGIEALKNSAVAVFGVGGVGSHCIEALARAGIGQLILIDNDTVSLTNLNRQSIALHSTLGRYKTHVMKERIKDISPSTSVQTYETFINPDNLLPLLESVGATVDYLIDAIDTVSAKLAIAEYAIKRKIPIISSMGTGNKLHGELFEIADIADTSVCPLCRVMRRELKKRGIYHLKVLYSKEVPIKHIKESEETSQKRSTPGSISFVPLVAGLFIAGEVIRSLLQAE